SCLVRINSIFERRSDSTTSRFSSPGTPKMYSTPSFSSAATSRSDPLVICPSFSAGLCVSARAREPGRFELVTLVGTGRSALTRLRPDSPDGQGADSGTRRNGLGKADLDVAAKLLEQGLERGEGRCCMDMPSL